MAVRSKQLAAVELAGAGPTTVYTVPAGFRTIIKGIALRNTTAAATALTVQVWAAGARISYHAVWLAAFAGSGDSTFENTFIVVEAGQSVRIGAGANGAVVILSGAELLL